MFISQCDVSQTSLAGLQVVTVMHATVAPVAIPPESLPAGGSEPFSPKGPQQGLGASVLHSKLAGDSALPRQAPCTSVLLPLSPSLSLSFPLSAQDLSPCCDMDLWPAA